MRFLKDAGLVLLAALLVAVTIAGCVVHSWLLTLTGLAGLLVMGGWNKIRGQAPILLILLIATPALAENALDVALRQNAGEYRHGDQMLTSAAADRARPSVVVEPAAVVEERRRLAEDYARRVIAEHDRKLMLQPLFIQLNNLAWRLGMQRAPWTPSSEELRDLPQRGYHSYR